MCSEYRDVEGHRRRNRRRTSVLSISAVSVDGRPMADRSAWTSQDLQALRNFQATWRIHSRRAAASRADARAAVRITPDKGQTGHEANRCTSKDDFDSELHLPRRLCAEDSSEVRRPIYTIRYVEVYAVEDIEDLPPEFQARAA